MKKNFLSKIFLFALIISALFILTSCGEREFEGLTFSDATYAYDGCEHSIAVEGAPAEAVITYSPSNVQTSGGTYLITATVSAENYKTLTLSATLKIVYPEDYALDSDIEALIERLNEAIADINSRNDAKILALKNEYQEKLDALTELNDETKAALDTLEDTYLAKVAELEAESLATETAITELTAYYDEELTKLKTANSDILEEIASLTESYNDALDALEKAEEDTSEAIAALDAKYTAELNALLAKDTENQGKIDTLTAKYNDEVEPLKTQVETLAASLEALEASYNLKVIELTNLISANNGKIDNIKGELQTNINNLAAKHTNDINAITTLITSLESIGTTNAAKIAELEAKVNALLTGTNHTVTFDLGGAAGSTSSVTIKHGEKVTKPTDPTREGYAFIGWYVGDEKWSFVGYTVTEDITLTAKWASTKILSLANGYTLDGDKISATLRYPIELVNVFNVVEIGNMCEATLYKNVGLTDSYAYGRMTDLVYGVNRAYLVIECEGTSASVYEVIITLVKMADFYSEGELFATTVVENDKIYAPNTAPVSQNSGYEFDYWKVNGEEANFPYDYADSLEFEAVFKPITYTITYCENEGTMPESYATTYTGGSSITLPVPTRSLFIFEGWYDSADFSGQKITEISATDFGDKTFYAKWKSATNGLLLSLRENEDGEYYVVTGHESFDTVVVIPEEIDGIPVTEIADQAFYSRRLITSITIPTSVTSIGDSVFIDCTSLENITVSTDNTAYKSVDGILYTKDGKTLIQYPGAKDDTSFTIPSGVENLGENAFFQALNLTSIIIPDGVTTIGNSTFHDCIAITSIIIPDSVTSIGDYAFGRCENLTSIAVSAGNTAYSSIDGNLYTKDGKTLVRYAIGKTDSSFTLPNGVTSIGNAAFYKLRNLTSIVIPDSVTNISSDAFYDCTNLTEIYYTGSEEEWNAIVKGENWDSYIGEYTITYNHVVEGGGLVGTEGVEYSLSGDGTYAIVTGYTGSEATVVIADSYMGAPVTEISDMAFFDNSSITGVVIPKSVTKIGNSAFAYCTRLTSIKYTGSKAEWDAIEFGTEWKDSTGAISMTYNYTEN